MTTLVTGATGLVGNNAVRALRDRGENVRVLTRNTSAKRPLEDLDLEVVQGDVRDFESVERACQGVSLVIHAAAYVHWGWSNIETHRAVNVTGTHNVCRAALAADAKMVHVSSVDTLGVGDRQNPADEDSREGAVPAPYVLTKREAESEVLDHVRRGLVATIVNPTFMLGPWDWKPSSGKLLLAAGTRFTPLVPSGGNNFCDVRDVVQGILAAAERGQSGRRYLLGGDDLTYLEAFRLFAEVTGGRPPLTTMGPLMRVLVGRGGDLWGRISGSEPDVNSAALASASLPHCCSSARAERELEYRHRPAKEAARAAWDWFCQYGYVRQIPS
jgi:dihydroflavonol-4-reductase